MFKVAVILHFIMSYVMFDKSKMLYNQEADIEKKNFNNKIIDFIYD